MDSEVRLVSTRGGAPPVGPAAAVLAGPAPDGGLYVPESWPRPSLSGLDARSGFPAAAAAVLAPFTSG